MFSLTRPTPAQIERFLAASRELELTYDPVGIARGTPRGFTLDTTEAVIGRGRADFERAVAALHAWRQFDVGWGEIVPRGAPVAEGTVVGALFRHLGFWSLNGARVVYVIGDDASLERGFAYGTLSNHAECGEEIFTVALDPATDTVTYRIRAVSHPRAFLARCGYPAARMLQARFRRDSVRAMRRAAQEVRSSGDSTGE